MSHTDTEAFLGSNEKFKAEEDQTNTNDKNNDKGFKKAQ